MVSVRTVSRQRAGSRETDRVNSCAREPSRPRAIPRRTPTALASSSRTIVEFSPWESCQERDPASLAIGAEFRTKEEPDRSVSLFINILRCAFPPHPAVFDRTYPSILPRAACWDHCARNRRDSGILMPRPGLNRCSPSRVGDVDSHLPLTSSSHLNPEISD
jgi:hypothetical protein